MSPSSVSLGKQSPRPTLSHSCFSKDSSTMEDELRKVPWERRGESASPTVHHWTGCYLESGAQDCQCHQLFFWALRMTVPQGNGCCEDERICFLALVSHEQSLTPDTHKHRLLVWTPQCRRSAPSDRVWMERGGKGYGELYHREMPSAQAVTTPSWWL